MILILRGEIVCLILLTFLWFFSSKLKTAENSKSFARLIVYALIHIVFASASILAANGVLEVVPRIAVIFHVIFYLSAIMFEKEILFFVINMFYPKRLTLFKIINIIIIALYLIFIIALYTFPSDIVPITYESIRGMYFGKGAVMQAGYLIAVFYFIMTVCVIAVNRKKMRKKYMASLLPLLCVLIIIDVVQAVLRPFLFSCGLITIEAVVFFLFLENPVLSFEKKLMTDALTGMGSRHNYENAIEELGKKYIKNPSDTYLIAFCDINRLRAVNNHYGHLEGDKYITLVANVLSECLKNAYGIYRIGGDEFVAIYTGKNELLAVSELNSVGAKLKEKGADLEYDPSVSIGYAVSEKNYKNINEIIQAADYAMYAVKNRTEAKDGPGAQKLNLDLSGLKDKFFDALCMSGNFDYLFMSNLETHVSRISPEWKDDFGFESEFIYDFWTVWAQRIHPDDRQAFLDTVSSISKGHKFYKELAFRASGKDGEYKKFIFRASFLSGSGDDPDLLLGYMTFNDTI